jgi:hypothetical protein
MACKGILDNIALSAEEDTVVWPLDARIKFGSKSLYLFMNNSRVRNTRMMDTSYVMRGSNFPLKQKKSSRCVSGATHRQKLARVNYVFVMV